MQGERLQKVAEAQGFATYYTAYAFALGYTSVQKCVDEKDKRPIYDFQFWIKEQWKRAFEANTEPTDREGFDWWKLSNAGVFADWLYDTYVKPVLEA